ncbi:hypothetical protein [Virgisporangium aurantiacum]|uniref:Uncharacterized protein n=1 Tax=Virgisporangium aurantiacum TaxID=175570 RepID=A0A8J3Z0U6_9ACTN|nr:hypothetical protein [Virgisporangium aurantiacum]GIJ54247.1 hypothetical protein Vau01_017630 [Virgisporangium aurantiacum]
MKSFIRWDRGLLQAGLVLLLTAVSVLTFVSPAAAAAGPYHRSCIVHERQVSFDFWLRWETISGVQLFSVDRVKWNTGGFTPSRMAISLRADDGETPLVRAWGGSASTLHDVGATGDTGSNWEQNMHNKDVYQGVYARVYLNADEWCNTPLVAT